MDNFQYVEEGTSVICVFCLAIPVNASSLSCCQAIFCEGCLLRWFEDKKCCPMCRCFMERKNISAQSTLRRVILNLKAKCKECGVEGPMVTLLKTHTQRVCLPKKKLIFSFNGLCQGTTLKVLASLTKWVYCFQEDVEDIFCIPQNYLTPLVAPPLPTFTREDFNELFNIDDLHPMLQVKFEDQLKNLLKSITNYCENEIGRMVAAERKDYNLIKLAMERFPKDYDIQLLCCEAIYWFCKTQSNNKLISETNIHESIQRSMQQWPCDHNLQLSSLYALQNLLHQCYENKTSAMKARLYFNIQNALREFSDKEIQIIGINTLFNLTLPVYESNDQPLIRGVEKREFLESKIFVEIQRAMEFFPYEEAIQCPSVSLLAYFSTTSIFREQALQSRVHLLIQAAMKRFPDFILQKKGCETLSRLWKTSEVYRKALLHCRIQNE
eukprot:Awhi_evm1s64